MPRSRLFRPVFVLALFLVLLPTGCTAKGTIRASEIKDLVIQVRKRHDMYVNGDITLTPTEKRAFLRSTELLQATVDTAASPSAD